ncbi:hypothetical protein H1Z61_12335 [Bacillus aquiflavi]|uniref:Uncharacterized protein n=2 Tax=Bacillus aquiflavi TaxID=2672567 RepID=A0A6B3VZ17_9BACI|nr:hypothetical protein [Bacillus aquiflavi]MBA4537896.1 hypothetical protein [Bacillus aquiflavi]NEY82152.1 hypothetical protein [Bacillus aquiflavi]UAC48407.1 hypothetical protein K6959_18265 [Bacillus aquiflavi]
MQLSPDDVELILLFIAGWFVIQIVYSFLVLIGGRIITDYFEWAVYEAPPNLFWKCTNFFMYFFFGAGPYLNKKFMRYSWIKRKFLLFLSIIVMFVLSVILYQFILKPLVHWLFL